MKFFKKLVLAVLLASLLASFAIFSGCTRKDGEPPMFSGQSTNSLKMLVDHGVMNSGKHQYAVINREWILWCYSDFRSWLGSGAYGVVRWDDRSQCTLFASAFEVYVQLAYFRQAFHSDIKAPGAAVGVFWYIVNPSLGFGATNNGHALNQIITQNGREFFEPQTGKFVTLTPEQIRSAMLSKFD